MKHYTQDPRFVGAEERPDKVPAAVIAEVNRVAELQVEDSCSALSHHFESHEEGAGEFVAVGVHFGCRLI